MSNLKHSPEPGPRTPHTLRRPRRRQVLAGLAGIAALPVLAACSSDDPLAAQAGNADGKNYIAGDGSVLEIGPEERGEPVQFSSTLFSGEPISTDSLVGDPAVLNFWYAACAPCRVEAPDLQALHEELEPQGVRFALGHDRLRPTAGRAHHDRAGPSGPGLGPNPGNRRAVHITNPDHHGAGRTGLNPPWTS